MCLNEQVKKANRMKNQNEKILVNNILFKQIIVVFMFLSVNHFALSQNMPNVEKGNFKVSNIDDTFLDFYLIFVEKGGEKYTIHSPTSITIKGQKIEVGKEYYLELQHDNDLSNEFDLASSFNQKVYLYGKYKRSQLGNICTTNNLIGLTIPALDTNTETKNGKKIIGVFTQKYFYRFIIVEFDNDMTFNYHIMSERAHRQTSGKYEIKGDTIILNSYSSNSDFDFVNKRWILLNKKQIITSGNLNDKKENWSILKKDKQYDSIPKQKSDFAIKIDSIKINELSWIEDTIDYDSELKVIIREPLPQKDALVIIDGIPNKYDFLLNYYTMKEIESIEVLTKDELNVPGIYGDPIEYGLILVKTK